MRIFPFFRKQSNISEILLSEAFHGLKKALQNYDLEHIFDGIDEVIYITSIPDDRVLYMNKKGKEIFGEDFKDKKCYEYIGNQLDKCDHCLKNISPSEESLYKPSKAIKTNRINQRKYYTIEMFVRWNGSGIVKFELAIDLTDLL